MRKVDDKHQFVFFAVTFCFLFLTVDIRLVGGDEDLLINPSVAHKQIRSVICLPLIRIVFVAFH